MKHEYETIELAFEFVSSAPQFENEAILSLDTGETYFVSCMFDSDELLDHSGMLDEWHAYENAQTKASLRQWCADNNIELAD